MMDVRRVISIAAKTSTRVAQMMIRPLERRLENMISRVVLEAADDSTKFQSVRIKALADEVMDGVEHMQPGGLSHRPGGGAEGLVVCVAGHRDHPVVLNLSSRSGRPLSLKVGETVLYSTGSNGGIGVMLDDAGDTLLGGEDADDPTVVLSKMRAAITAMLATGIGTTGTEAFAAAKTAWDAAVAPAPMADLGSSKVKAKT